MQAAAQTAFWTWPNLAFLIAIVVTLILLVIGLVIAWKILTDKIDITYLLAEPDSGKASISRFQFLLFAFVVAGLLLMLSIESGAFVEVPQSVLVLLGLSGGGYVASKTIQAGVQKTAIQKGAAAPGAPPKFVQPQPPQG
ncbi:MAG: hypothetical protein ACREHE_07485 [Rhizomicrobium sp.]